MNLVPRPHRRKAKPRYSAEQERALEDAERLDIKARIIERGVGATFTDRDSWEYSGSAHTKACMEMVQAALDFRMEAERKRIETQAAYMNQPPQKQREIRQSGRRGMIKT
jgi:hypothetical protein